MKLPSKRSIPEELLDAMRTLVSIARTPEELRDEEDRSALSEVGRWLEEEDGKKAEEDRQEAQRHEDCWGDGDTALQRARRSPLLPLRARALQRL